MEHTAVRNTLIEATRFPLSSRALVARRGPWQAMVRNAVLKKLERLAEGEIRFVEAGETRTIGKRTAGFDLHATVWVRDPAMWPMIAFGGTVGAAEAYIEGMWDVDDLVALVRIFTRNRELVDGMETGLARLATPLHKAYHLLRDNTKSGAKKNIVAHYDLGNDFYQLFLDPTLTYSAGVFEHADATMEEASLAKIDRLCEKLDLRPEHHLLEVGTGWGAFAIRAAQTRGCRVTTTTISREQHRLAVERVKAAGLEDRVTVLECDYRDLQGEFDRIVSVEMIEAVGHPYYEEYFKSLGRLLKPDGLCAIQAITIQDQYYDRAAKSVDFIQRYVFPGSTIPSLTRILQASTRSSDLKLTHLEDLTPHYATTLRLWRERFHENLAAVRALGQSEAFTRLWNYYLCYCEGGFAERAIGSVQLLFAKPMNRRDPILPKLA